MDLGRRTSLSSSLVLKGLTMLGQALSSFLYIGRFIRIRDWLGELEGALPKPLQIILLTSA